MVITAEDTFGGGFTFFGEPVNGNGEPILEENANASAEDLEKIVDQLKPLWPLAAIPLVIQLWNRFKKREDDVPWEAIARAIAPIVAPIILSVLWVGLTKIDKKIDWLSNMIAVAEVLPTVDLNIPQGVVLGSMYSSAEDVQKVLTAVIEAGEKLADLDIGDIIPEIPTEGVTEKLFRAFVGGEPIGNLIADLVYGKK